MTWYQIILLVVSIVAIVFISDLLKERQKLKAILKLEAMKNGTDDKNYKSQMSRAELKEGIANLEERIKNLDEIMKRMDREKRV